MAHNITSKKFEATKVEKWHGQGDWQELKAKLHAKLVQESCNQILKEGKDF